MRTSSLSVSLLIGLFACGRRSAPPADTTPPVIEIDSDSVAVVTPGEIESGPLVSGTLRPTREATLRSEVAGSIIAPPPDVGTPVKQGTVLVRFDDQAIRSTLASARSTVQSARAARALAERDLGRARHLAQAGATSTAEVEAADKNLIAARAAAADASARLASASDNTDRANVRAPFDGVVSARSVNGGDVVQPGTPLVTVIDPSTLRLEAAVPADRIGEVRVGHEIDFQISGYDRRFEATIDRISPATDPMTGQVAVTAALAPGARNLIAGLHAEGQVLSRRAAGLIAPLAAIDRRRLATEVLRLDDGKVDRVAVHLGLVDDINQRVVILAGLHPGDVVLLGQAQQIAEGSRVRVAEPPRASAR